MTRIWNIVNDQKNAKYHVGNEIIYNTEVSKSNLFEQNDAYILVKKILLSQQLLQNNYHLRIVHHLHHWITKIDGTTIYDTEDLDFVLPI